MGRGYFLLAEQGEIISENSHSEWTLVQDECQTNASDRSPRGDGLSNYLESQRFHFILRKSFRRRRAQNDKYSYVPSF